MDRWTEVVRNEEEAIANVLAMVNFAHRIQHYEILAVFELLKQITNDRVSKLVFERFAGVDITHYRIRLSFRFSYEDAHVQAKEAIVGYDVDRHNVNYVHYVFSKIDETFPLDPSLK